MSIREDIEKITRRSRVYAALREGGTKGQKELGVISDLLDAMKRSGTPKYSHPKLSPVDPPDCIGRNDAGHLVAFEVTEFVSQRAVEINEGRRTAPGQMPPIEQVVMATWNKESVVEKVTSALRAKDDKNYLGGPYAEIVTVIHTDEPLLVRLEAEGWLSRSVFGPYRQITSAYFLYRYESGAGYPFQAVSIRSA